MKGDEAGRGKSIKDAQKGLFAHNNKKKINTFEFTTKRYKYSFSIFKEWMHRNFMKANSFLGSE